MLNKVTGKTAYRLAAFVISMLLLISLIPALPAQAATKIVRVGWYDSPFNMKDARGRRSGYAYEYQRKIAAYTGWTYEYVEGSWFELMEMLERGEIDLMSDVSYSEERAEKMLFPSMTMGTEAYYLYIAAYNDEISAEDYTALTGKTVGITKGSIQIGFFEDWMAYRGIEAEIVELAVSEDESIQTLLRGEVDALVTMDMYCLPSLTVPVYKIGSADFYFAVNKDRPDLLAELDAALSRIYDENRYYNEQLYDKYMKDNGTSRYFSTEEKAYLYDHSVIRVGYQDNYLAFCAKDPATGELMGALKDYFDYASAYMLNGTVEFEPVCFSTAAEAIEALQRGEIDCMFPVNITDYDGEEIGVIITPPLIETEIYAVVKKENENVFPLKTQVKVAVNEGNPNYDLFLVDNFPGWETEHYADTGVCLEIVAAGKADCILISNYRFGNISRRCNQLGLVTVPTGVDMEYCFAVREDDSALYSVMSRIVCAVPEATVNAALAYHSAEDAQVSLSDYVRENLAAILGIIGVVVLIIIVLILRSIRAEHRVDLEHHMVDDLKSRVFVDALTKVRNKGAFNDELERLQIAVDRGEVPQFAVCVFDCDDLKKVNDRYGHDKGDEYLKTISAFISRTFEGADVYRIGGDEFAVILEDESYEKRDELMQSFAEERQRACEAAENRWSEVRVAAGLAAYDSAEDDTVKDTLHRADAIMYENKRRGKIGR